mmetsp:Transcript_1861/g.2948  ORF Transcript_1861/g.2948 Transcript_1861/m.2948 type:complete len:208 (+) Transcript_1861:922-1545(+)
MPNSTSQSNSSSSFNVFSKSGDNVFLLEFGKKVSIHDSLLFGGRFPDELSLASARGAAPMENIAIDGDLVFFVFWDMLLSLSLIWRSISTAIRPSTSSSSSSGDCFVISLLWQPEKCVSITSTSLSSMLLCPSYGLSTSKSSSLSSSIGSHIFILELCEFDERPTSLTSDSLLELTMDMRFLLCVDMSDCAVSVKSTAWRRCPIVVE